MKTKQEKTKKKSGCLWPIIVVVLVISLLSSCFDRSDSENEVSNTDSKAITEQTAEEGIEKQEISEETIPVEIETEIVEETPTEEVVQEQSELIEQVDSIPSEDAPLQEDPIIEADPVVEAPVIVPSEEEIIVEEYAPPAEQIVVPQSTIVYITNTGEKYHHGDCRHLKNSKIEISLDDAIAAGYTPCGTCH